MTRKQSSYPVQPPRDRGTGRAFLLAVLMHVLLGFFLYHGIHWQNSTPAGAEAELWTEVPDTSTPRPVAPPAPVAPAPPQPSEEADIALQQQKRKQQEAARQAQLAEQQRLQQQQQQEAEAKRQQQLAAQQAAQLAAQQKAAKLKQQQEQQAAAAKLKQQQLEAQKKQQQQEEDQKQAQLEAQKKAEADKAAKAKAQADAQAKKMDAERRARIAQMQGLAGGGESAGGNGLAKSGTGSGAGGTAASSGYAEKVQRLVRQHIIWPGSTEGLETVVAVRCAATGTLLNATITRSSGNPQWDAAALRAVQQSDPMPLDKDGKAPSSFTIILRPGG
ncbi:cell envelope integrity protein TolA [Paraburkholderia dinghuensis]|uniref:Cell envelope integrity protein TolA n=1 Tax=Paraburkholderia dinghuensis TaxID=2305225 RepID=A0A3N6P7D3_9BURK|nr:cell envelope integrity protein TolA [Paraburkholderia dinghuensis]RQH09953.1 cell envelope integrity protein TolA [Paraburkholderia dinghuensis]